MKALRFVRLTALALGAGMCLAGSPAPALAQVPVSAGPPRLSLAAGIGLAHPLHGDLGFTAGLWEVSARGRLGRRVALEGAISEWRHTTAIDRSDVPLHGPDGIIGHAGLIAERTTRASRSYQVNLVALGRAGPVTLSGGGGVGVLAMRREFTATVSDCISSVPVACADTRSEVSNVSASLQGVAAVDVYVASRMSAYGQFRFVGPTRDLGGSELRFAFGVRVAILPP
jgi:hypothetical protein